MAAAIKIVSERLLAGEKAQAKWKHGNKWFNVVVDAVNDDGTYSLSYEDGDKWDSVPPNRIRRMNGIILLDIQEPEKKKGNRALDKSGKWEILRNAILSSKASNVSSGDSSIHRHDGFHMFQKTVETDSTRIEEGYHVVSYKIPNSTDDGDVSLRILERQVGAKLSLSEIAPGKYGHGEGVDNTGNVRVWPAEEILLHVVLGGLKRSLSQTAQLSSFPTIFPSSFTSKGNKKVLELGGGMTSLAALGLAVSKLRPCDESDLLLFTLYTLTDGNPSSVSKQVSNIELNEHAKSDGVHISSHVLFWEPNDESGTEASLFKDLNNELKYDLIIGADLLFFESHGALALCLDRLLTDSGMVLLCQPSRGGTMEKFASHSQVVDKFNVAVYDTSSFDPQVAELHASYLADPTYDPSIHSPSLICLTRL